jgi:hypothetical protein
LSFALAARSAAVVASILSSSSHITCTAQHGTAHQDAITEERSGPTGTFAQPKMADSSQHE